MKEAARFFKLFSDETRLRVLMVLIEREMCVCQIMATLNISQPLVSRNLSMLERAGVLSERRDGKLMFYSINAELPSPAKKIIQVLKSEYRGNAVYEADLQSLKDCEEYQRSTGRCDMKAFQEFMEQQRNKRAVAVAARRK